MSRPLISAVIPVYNGELFLSETLDSVFAQTYASIEVIVVDDGSKDNSAEIVARYKPAIKYFWQENGGPGRARNAGIRAASGDYIAFLDHDDIWLPEKLEVQAEVASRHPESGIIACDGIEFSENQIISNFLLAEDIITELKQSSNGEITKYDFHKRILKYSPIVCPSQTLIPKKVLNALGPLTERRNEMSDYECYLRIAERYPFTFHRHSLVRYRYLPSSRSGPYSFRPFVYSKNDIVFLNRYRHVCPSPYRSDVEAALHGRIQQLKTVSINEMVSSGDLSYTFIFIRRLLLFVITHPVVLVYFVKKFPHWLGRQFKTVLQRMAIIREGV